jgi:uncharacterized circularly permuted ATP-grasp superfamily protein/uncharacterized alpha-E superfamily protein
VTVSAIGATVGSDPGRFDESSTWDASLREALVDPRRLLDWQHRVDRLLVAEGAGHLVHDLPVRADGRAATVESRPWRLDPVPIVIDTATFRWLSAAVVERMETLEAVLRDLYGERSLVRDGIVPSDALHSSRRYRVAAVGAPAPRRFLATYAVDLVRTASGDWRVVQDHTDAPPGVGYALLDRSVMSRVATDVLGRGGVASLARYPAVLRSAFAATSALPSPRTVLFSGGIDHPSYVDHSYLAVQLGVHLVEGADLVVRQRRVWLRTLDGVEPVDVVHRRLEDPGIDPLEVGATGSRGVPGLLLAVRSGGVALANAHGSGVLEDPELARWWAAAARHLAGTTLRVPPLEDPATVLASTPVLQDGVLAHGAAVLRLFAAHDGRSVSVMPGGTGRVLVPGDDPRVPTACAAKDVWVIGRTLTPLVAAPLPQVDFGRSVPTRAADALFWTNRAAERAEAMARTVRVISSRMEQDPGLVALDGGRWTQRMAVVARSVRRRAGDQLELSGLDLLTAELAVTTEAIGTEIGSLLTEATTVRDYLSVTTGRVLERLARLRGALREQDAAVDDLDALIVEFAALVGLWNESTVRGPAWRLGDAGRRIERALVVLDLVEGGFDPDADGSDPVEMLSIEVLLAANESLVAYRRRHRSDVEPAAAFELLVRDASNPRSLAACIDELRRHAVDADWPDGVRLAGAARDALGEAVPELLTDVRALIREAGRALVDRWFAAPVNPVPVVRR